MNDSNSNKGLRVLSEASDTFADAREDGQDAIEQHWIDLFAGAAARTPVPDDWDFEVDEEIVRSAMLAAERRRREQKRRTWVMASVGLAAAAAAIVFVGSTLPTNQVSVARTTLPSGDVIASLPGAQYAIENLDGSDRAIAQHRGAVLYDVAPLEDASAAFVVQTPDTTVRVHGTVFAVSVDSGRTRVELFEGRVSVGGTEGEVFLNAPALYDSTLGKVEDMTSWRSELATLGREAAQRRARSGRSVGNLTKPEGGTSAPTHGPSQESSTTVPQIPDSLLRARTALDTGEYGEVLSRARTALGDAMNVSTTLADQAPSENESGHVTEWHWLSAEAYRAMGDHARAVIHYNRAIPGLPTALRATAGLSCAKLQVKLHDARGALATLNRSNADGAQSPVAEPAAGLRVRVLASLNEKRELIQSIHNYLHRFPEGPQATWVRSLSP